MKAQRGVFLLEALIAILVFSLGILGMVAMAGTAMSAQSDAQYRTEAANYAQEIAAQINLDMVRGAYGTSILAYAHQASGGGDDNYCTFSGDPSTKQVVTDWVNRITGPGGLPGASLATQQIQIIAAPAGYNQVRITLCWQPPSNAALAFAPMHRHVYMTYIN